MYPRGGRGLEFKRDRKVRMCPRTQAVSHGKLFTLEIPLHCGLNTGWNISQGKAMHEIQNGNRKWFNTALVHKDSNVLKEVFQVLPDSAVFPALFLE